MGCCWGSRRGAKTYAVGPAEAIGKTSKPGEKGSPSPSASSHRSPASHRSGASSPGVKVASKSLSLEPTSAVYLTGLVKRSDLNGEAAHVVRREGNPGRWVVRLTLSGEEKALKPENLRPQGSVLVPGLAVQLRELRRALTLNGLEGKLVREDPQSGRWLVRIDATGEEKAVRPEHVLPLLPAFVRPSAVRVDEAERDTSGVERAALPPMWSSSEHFDGHVFSEVLYVSRVQHAAFNSLLAASYRSACSQDRPCPRGTCTKTPGGCPCARPGGDPGLPTGYEVRRVLRVENLRMWARYLEKQKQIRRQVEGETAALIDGEPRTAVVSSHPEIFAPLDRSTNEVYLWHGTQIRHALQIAKHDFQISFSGKGTGEMLGAGLYFSDSCTKADEYAFDEPGSHYDGTFAMLLCRVALGAVHYTTEKSVCDAGGTYHSVLCDREAAAGTFKEYVIYSGDQVYPEFVVLYRRMHAQTSIAEQTRMCLPFHLELPVYWRNFHRHPMLESFNEQCSVRPATRAFLSRLVRASTGPGCVVPRLREARRVENSRIWNRYMRFKDELKSRLKSNGLGRCAPPGDSEGSGEVATSANLGADERSGEAVFIDNLEQHLNEHLLWHGTSSQAAEHIAEHDFCIPKDAGNSLYGAGAYFAEDFAKCLAYAESKSAAGSLFVLLCRVCCGEFYHVQVNTDCYGDPDAVETAAAQGKDSVLAADPTLRRPREFIALSEDQVYPEFILEFVAT